MVHCCWSASQSMPLFSWCVCWPPPAGLPGTPLARSSSPPLGNSEHIQPQQLHLWLIISLCLFKNIYFLLLVKCNFDRTNIPVIRWLDFEGALWKQVSQYTVPTTIALGRSWRAAEPWKMIPARISKLKSLKDTPIIGFNTPCHYAVDSLHSGSVLYIERVLWSASFLFQLEAQHIMRVP